MSKEDAVTAGLYEVIGKEVDDAYIAEVEKQVINQASIDEMASKLKIVYTPLHGTGNLPVRRVLDDLGLRMYMLFLNRNFQMVTSQQSAIQTQKQKKHLH